VLFLLKTSLATAVVLSFLTNNPVLSSGIFGRDLNKVPVDHIFYF